MVDRQEALEGGGQAGSILRKLDWSTLSIGPPKDWPTSFRVALDIVLTVNYPMLIWWGKDLTQFYNDFFRDIAWPCGAHPDPMANSGRKSWLWNFIGGEIQGVLAGKGAVQRPRRRLQIAAGGRTLVRYWTYSLTPISERDEVSGVLLACRDKTPEERKDLNSLVRERELIRIQHVSGVGGLEVDLTAGFRNRRSPEYLAIHGLPPAALYETHENWVRRIHPEDRERTEGTFVEAVKGDCKGYSIQYRIIRPSDGKIRWISAKTEIERDNSGRAMRLIGAHADVTDQIDIAEFERGRFTAALDLLRCAVLLTHADGHIVYMNCYAEALMNRGRSVRCVLNTLKAALPSADKELRLALKLTARAEPQSIDKRLTVRLSDDSPPLWPIFCRFLSPRFTPPGLQRSLRSLFMVLKISKTVLS